MKWKKIGRVFEHSNGIPWIKTHAMIPLADHREEDVFRIYFSPRDDQNCSNTAWIDIDITRPTEILAISKQPVMTRGPLGGFDDSGVIASWMVNNDNKKHLYFFGYSRGVTVLCKNFIGLAVSEDNGATFQKFSQAPIVGCSDHDPFFAVTPCVLRENNIWKMWYASSTGWGPELNGSPRPNYRILYTESLDGIQWNSERIVCIDYQSDKEYAIARPSVFKEKDHYQMWFCCRGDHYLLGYAESHDGKKWERKDHLAGLTVSDNGWDSEMIAYPFVFTHKQQTYMLYNGNQYGLTGFGLAVLEQ